MNQNENEYMTNFHGFNQITTSPQSRRNTKNLSLKLNSNQITNTTNNNNNSNISNISNISKPQSPIPFPNIKSNSTTRSISASPIVNSFNLNSNSSTELSQSNPPPRLFRHPSLSLSKNSNSSNSSNLESNSSLRRRRTLTLSIPTESESNSKTSAKLSSNSIPSISSSSPINSSPIVPSTPLDFNNLSNPLFKRSTSTTSSNKTLQKNDECLNTTIDNNNNNNNSNSNSNDNTNNNDNNNNSSNILRTQTLIQNLSSMDLSDEGDMNKVNAYPNGPICVMEPNLYLYSEPTAEQLKPFKLIINVAKELTPPLSKNQLDKLIKNQINNIKLQNNDNNNNNKNNNVDQESTYIFVPWTHTSKLCLDLPILTDLIIKSLEKNEKILIHCQCGISRSASLIVALFMKLKKLNLNDSYNLLKNVAPDISPNMSLIFQLMEWGEIIGVSDSNSNNYDLCDSPISLQQQSQQQQQQQQQSQSHDSQNDKKDNSDIQIHNVDPVLSYQ